MKTISFEERQKIRYAYKQLMELEAREREIEYIEKLISKIYKPIDIKIEWYLTDIEGLGEDFKEIAIKICKKYLSSINEDITQLVKDRLQEIIEELKERE